MFRKNAFLIFIIPVFLLFSGCDPQCDINDFPTFFPILVSPEDGAIISYDNPPVFDWRHEESCNPEYYLIHFEREDGSKKYSNVPGDTTTFIMEKDLLPGFSYEWYVEPLSYFKGDGSEGSNSQTIIGNRSQTWSFTTDGRCSPSELEPPVLVKPQNEKWISDNHGYGESMVEIKWNYPGDCYPEYFQYQLSANPDFTNLITSGITDWDETSLWLTVPKCSRIYWRVAARTGNSSGGYSDPFRFTFAMDFGCWQNQTSIDAALIKGYVFEDYCKTTIPYVPEGVGIAPPCIFGEPYGVHADGFRARVETENEMTGEMNPAEIGIPGVIVDLGAGPCPSTGLEQGVTGGNGNYYFMVQSPGQYCVSIDKANNPSLDHGIWTLPLTDQDITEATITFNPGDDLIIQNFGWDQNDFLRIDFLVDLLSFCRSGDSKDHLAVAEVPAGAVIPIFARNEDATWFATLVNGKRCFISIASGKPAEDSIDLMIYPKQPDPVIPDQPDPGSSDDTPGSSSKKCSDYKTEETCMAKGCEWSWTAAGPGICRNP